MSAIPLLGNALHSRHIRGAYNRRRDDQQQQQEKKSQEQVMLKRSHSSHARLATETESGRGPAPHHASHHHTGHDHHHAHHHAHLERPVFALSQPHERDALLYLSVPVPRRQHHSAPELYKVEVGALPVAEQVAPRTDWRWETSMRRMNNFNVTTTGLCQGIVDVLQQFGAAPNH